MRIGIIDILESSLVVHFVTRDVSVGAEGSVNDRPSTALLDETMSYLHPTNHDRRKAAKEHDRPA